MKPGASRKSYFQKFQWTPLLVLLLLTAVAVKDSHALEIDADFDHDKTGFPLDFKHAFVKCESCHVQAIFIGTPRQCAECHANGGRIKASAPSSRHMQVTGECDYCHQPVSWSDVVQVDHFAVSGSCQSCHNGITAAGKNPGHIQSAEVCDDCHRTFAWEGAAFDHANVDSNCISCHNHVTATGKNPEHILSANACEDCHSTFNWTPVIRVDHSSVLGSCSSCHNGIKAEGKHPQHIATNSECDLCHNSLGWLPAGFVHQSLNYPGEHRRNLDCVDCHVGNSSAVAWPSPAYQPDCAGCHATDYKAGVDKHKGLSQDRNCGNSGCHRVSGSEW